MHKGARTALCGGRSVMVVPTATAIRKMSSRPLKAYPRPQSTADTSAAQREYVNGGQTGTYNLLICPTLGCTCHGNAQTQPSRPANCHDPERSFRFGTLKTLCCPIDRRCPGYFREA